MACELCNGRTRGEGEMGDENNEWKVVLMSTSCTEGRQIQLNTHSGAVQVRDVYVRSRSLSRSTNEAPSYSKDLEIRGVTDFAGPF